MRLKDIEDKYMTLKNKGRYLLYDKRKGSCNRHVHKYLAAIEWRKGKANVIGFPPVTSLDELHKQVNGYGKSLPFDTSYYDPTLRGGYLEYMVLYDYLTASGSHIMTKCS